MPTVNSAIPDFFYLATDTGTPTPITGADLGDFTATAKLIGTATTAVVTITEDESGEYDTSFVPTVVGRWKMSIVYDDGTIRRGPFTGTYDVDLPVLEQPVGGAAGTAGAALASLSTGTVTITSPVDAGNAVTLVIGDSYLAADGRAIEFTSTGWPDLTGATVEMRIATITGERDPFPMSVVTPTGTAKVRLERTAEQTGALSPFTGRYEVVATLAGGSIVTLVTSTILVKE